MYTKIYDELTPEVLVKWNALWKSSEFANFTNSPDWFIAADATYNYKDKKIITLFDESNNLIGVGAFVKEKIAGIAVWTVPADEFACSEPLLLDYKNRGEVNLYVEAIGTIGTTVLPNFKTKTLQFLFDNKHVILLPYDTNHYIDFTESPYGSLSPHRLRRIEKQLKKDNLIWSKKSDVTDKMNGLLEAYKIEKESSKRRNGKGVFDNELSRKFYEKLIEVSAENVSITFITINNKNVAYSIDFKNKNTMIGSQKAHLYEMNQYSPGRLLIASLCDEAREKNQPYFDFGRGSDSFKKSFSTRNEILYIAIISNKFLPRIYVRSVFCIKSYIYDRIASVKIVYLFYKKIRKGGSNE